MSNHTSPSSKDLHNKSTQLDVTKKEVRELDKFGRTEPDLVATRQGSFGVQDDGDTTGFGLFQEKITMPGQSERPYGGYFDEIVDILEELIDAAGLRVSDVIEKVVVDRDELTIYIARQHIVEVCKWMRDDQDLRFEMNFGVSAVHYPEQLGRELHACWQLYSYTHSRTVRLEVTCPDSDPHIPSVVSIYPGDDWWEREAWDLMGIIFDGHPNLTRSAMPDDWVGHPQRKDYPLGGIPVQYKGATIPPADTRRVYR
ncbi:MAG: NADH-quinone oxidoreductase subunit C [Actinomycetaceae bacterium]|nr:NADH-quinone oxidoreductase subunit C [Actinomycetaceae bacterium]